MATRTAIITLDDGRQAEVDVDVPDTEPKDSRSMLGKAWDMLSIPEQKSREGLTKLTDLATPSRQDIESGKVGIPGIAARTAGETLSEVAPSFISPLALATTGALGALKGMAPAVKAVGGFLGRTGEATSGLAYKTPGVLADAYNDPSLIFGKGKQAAGELYKAVQNVNQISPDLQSVSNQRPFVMKALRMAQEGALTPDEALEARKALDSLDNVPDVFRRQTRAVFDALAKQKFEEADKAYARAVKSEALRTFWGINKSGSPSIFKEAIMSGGPLAALMTGNPLGLAAEAVFSPMVQGAIATGAGAVGKYGVSPILSNSNSFGPVIGAAKNIYNRMRTPYQNENQ